MKYAMFIGRWQPFHKGHRWLIDQKLKKEKPVLICIRDIEPDKYNPLTAQEVMWMLADVFEKEIGMVRIKIIPDIESINYGRGVGYEINEHAPPDNIKTISATEIREKINNDESWKDMVDSGAIKFLEKKFGQDQ